MSVHRRANAAGIDVELFEELEQRAETHGAAARNDGIAEYGDDDRSGARRFALELVDNAGKRMRHALRHTAFCAGTTTEAWSTLRGFFSFSPHPPSPRLRRTSAGRGEKP